MAKNATPNTDNAPAKVKVTPNHATVTITMSFEQEAVFKTLVGENKTSPFVRMAIREYAKTQNVDFPADKEKVSKGRPNPRITELERQNQELREAIARMMEKIGEKDTNVASR